MIDRTVLIVEDDAGVRDMFELLFAADGYHVEVAVDGPTAAERLTGEPVDLVVLDVMLPGRDGIDLLQVIRESPDPQWRETPVIISTARGSDEAVWDGWRAGADYYLVKPFDLDEMRGVAAQLVDGGTLEPH